ncbi:MAG: nitroreductase family protein [Planctomycetota bacterium]|nr:MAG: nitroreductase family protein [Planctomycetota bacterium]
MELLELIRNRRSIRQFQSKKIPSDYIEKLKESLIWAPSAGNLQSRKFYFVFSDKKKKAIAQAALDQMFIAQAPLVVVGCADSHISQKYGTRGVQLYSICDVSLSMAQFMLLASSLGLGSVWVGAFQEDRVRQILDIPSYLRPIVLLPVGYSKENPLPPPRVSLSEAIKEVFS